MMPPGTVSLRLKAFQGVNAHCFTNADSIRQVLNKINDRSTTESLLTGHSNWLSFDGAVTLEFVSTFLMAPTYMKLAIFLAKLHF